MVVKGCGGWVVCVEVWGVLLEEWVAWRWLVYCGAVRLAGMESAVHHNLDGNAVGGSYGQHDHMCFDL